MAQGHGHTQDNRTLPEGRLRLALVLTGIYLLAEVVGGLVFGSLALLSDATHMFTDFAALVIALAAIRLGKRPADPRRTFGYKRFEILAAALNASVLFLVAFYILFEAYQRLREPVEIQSLPMLLVALGGLAVNLIAARLLAAGSAESLNVKGAYLEVLSDLLGSLAVIAGAIVIYFTGWNWVDPLLATLISLWILPRTWHLLSASVNILLEGVPGGIDLRQLQADLAALPGVQEVHDLHVWALTQGQNAMSVHLVTQPETADPGLVQKAQEVAGSHGIEHTTIQIEDRTVAENESGAHRL
ncbi:MAG: cation diffusion facilitator family transporter [Deinococcus sp.]|nr:cation diffusion facilitator family transporter [Deinococcus sp.]